MGWNVSQYLQKTMGRSMSDIFPPLEESRHEAEEILL